MKLIRRRDGNDLRSFDSLARLGQVAGSWQARIRQHKSIASSTWKQVMD